MKKILIATAIGALAGLVAYSHKKYVQEKKMTAILEEKKEEPKKEEKKEDPSKENKVKDDSKMFRQPIGPMMTSEVDTIKSRLKELQDQITSLKEESKYPFTVGDFLNENNKISAFPIYEKADKKDSSDGKKNDDHPEDPKEK